MTHPIKHFMTIEKHRHLVMRHCFKVGLIWQGLTHDLSKFSYSEFWKSASHYQGNKSPNEGERADYGYSLAWMHHKGRNKHHFEYWTDVDPVTKMYHTVPMPICYLAESFCDRVAASKVYRGKDYKDEDAYLYFTRGKGYEIMERTNAELLKDWLKTLAEEGEASAFAKVKAAIKNDKKRRKKHV